MNNKKWVDGQYKVNAHYYKNNTHLAWIEGNECGHMVISSLLNVSVLTSECELRIKFQHISALRCECQYTHLWGPKHLDVSADTLRIELNVVPTKKIVPLSTT